MKKRRSDLGYTLLEMIVVVVLIGIVATQAMGIMAGLLKSGRRQEIMATVYQEWSWTKNKARMDGHKHAWVMYRDGTRAMVRDGNNNGVRIREIGGVDKILLKRKAFPKKWNIECKTLKFSGNAIIISFNRYTSSSGKIIFVDDHWEGKAILYGRTTKMTFKTRINKGPWVSFL